MRMAVALAFEQRVDERGIQVVERGLWHDRDVVLRLALLIKQTIDLVGGHLAVAVAGADVGAAVRADRGDEAGLLPRQHLVDDGEHQIRALERAGHDHGPDHGRELLAGLAQRLLHGAGVEALDRREPRLLAQPQDDVPAVAVGERGQRLGDGRADSAFALLDLALLRVVADGAQQCDELGHLGRVVVVVHRSSGGVPLPPGDVCTPAVLHPAPSVRRPPRAPATILCRRRHRIVAMTCAGSVPSASRIWWGPRRDRSPSRAPPLPYGRVVRGNQSTASIACLRSAMMSSAFSMPQLRRTRSMPTPASMSCSSVS